MPNWFYFTLEVSGKEKDVQDFVQNVKGSKQYNTEDSVFDFNHFIPQPDNLFRGNLGIKEEEECKEKGIPNWYHWNVDNWGTKWNACCDNEEGEGTNYHTYNLSTAWAFPAPIIVKMFDMYPQLSFEIEGEEESMSYGVYIKQDNGTVITWAEEEPDIVDDYNNREVYWESDEHVWKYLDNDEEVEDSDDFYPTTKYSWS